MSSDRDLERLIEDLARLRWPRDREKFAGLESEIRSRTRLSPLQGEPRRVAGVDAAFFGDRIIGAACLYEYPEMTRVAEATCEVRTTFPYIPGYLSFREGPAVIRAVRELPEEPDVVLFDGQGIAHPRGLGIAAVAGTLMDIPSVGVAKSRLVGEHGEPGPLKGDRTPLTHGGSVVGAVVRTRDRVKPLFVSPGHAMDVEGAVKIVLACAVRYRLPEPVRCADSLSRKISAGLRSRAAGASGSGGPDGPEGKT